MAEVLFPKRQRCKKCSKGLGAQGAPVYLGLFCAPRCASLADPILDPAKAPRECKTQRDGVWAFKRRYRSEGEIPDKIKDDASTNWYWCGHCGHYHVGHTRMGEAEKFRLLTSPEDLADLLVKLRGQATHTQVAKAAGVRPIRLKELETGVRHEEGITTLFKVLAVLRARPGVAIESVGGRR